jgi:transposase
MTGIVVHLRRWEQRRLQRLMRTTRDAGIRSRTLIVVHAAAGKSTAQIADAVGYDPSAVLKVLHRFGVEGEDGLRDHRADNGHAKVDDGMWGTLATLLVASPEDYGWARPTWTQELLARQLGRETGVRVSESTPGQNQKHYLAGALHTRTGQVLWVGNGRKNSYLFLQLLRKLTDAFPGTAKLHVILDNYGIHSSRLVQWALTKEFHGRIVLHFLPPYSPNDNRIERLWRELHANVTRNHRCATLAELLRRVATFLRRVSPYPGTKASLLRAPRSRAA